MSRCGCFVITMFLRFGRGWPRLSNGLRPMTITLPIVIFLNHLKSSGRCHGILFPAPITRFSDIAAMALKCFKVFENLLAEHLLLNAAPLVFLKQNPTER